ncbi:MAG: hypothetical protein MUC43_19200 [Pirellula sp.]|jgi:hypothetical protein|nr:hypothetical protein [Pirellula sp.]
MVVVFEQQCEIKLDKVEVRKSPGGDIDDNFCLCQAYGVELEAPVLGKCSEQKASSEVFSETDFPFEEREVIDSYGKKHIDPIITSCPAGKTPHRSHYHHGIGKMEILHSTETCQKCPLQSKCMQ